MSFVYVSLSGVPITYPRIFSGDGTLSENGRWSTSSVRKNFSVVYSLIFAVYSSWMACGTGDAGLTFADCAIQVCGESNPAMRSPMTSIGLVYRRLIDTP